MAELTIEQLDRKIKNFSKEQIAIVKRALLKASKVLVTEMKSRYRGVLGQKTGKTYRAIKRLKLKAGVSGVQLEVGVGTVGGKSQWYKAVSHEVGTTRVHPGGVPYFIGSDGKPVFVRKELLSLYPWLPRTRSYTIRIPKRPFVEPTRKSKLQAVKDMILKEAMEAYERVQA